MRKKGNKKNKRGISCCCRRGSAFIGDGGAEAVEASEYVRENSTIHGNVDDRGSKHTRTRMVAVRRESAGDISQRQIGWNGSERIESSAFWSSNPSTPHCCPSLYLFPSTSPFPDYSAFYLAHRCLSDRTPDTIFPLSSLSIPRTIIPRFISHRERKQVLLPFIGHTDGARSFQRDTIYHYIPRFVYSLHNPDTHHSRKVNKFLKRVLLLNSSITNRSHRWIGIRREARLSAEHDYYRSIVCWKVKWKQRFRLLTGGSRDQQRHSVPLSLPRNVSPSLSLSLSLSFSLSLSRQTMEMSSSSFNHTGWSVLSSRGCKLVRFHEVDVRHYCMRVVDDGLVRVLARKSPWKSSAVDILAVGRT